MSDKRERTVIDELIQIGQDLARQRQIKGLSLQELSTRIKINAKFLERMEGGNFSFLPDVYVRAFLRAYAGEIGLDPEVLLRRLDNIQKPVVAEPKKPIPHPAPAEEEPVLIQAPPKPKKIEPVVVTELAEKPEASRASMPPWLGRLLGGAAVLAIIVLIAWLSSREQTPPPVPQAPMVTAPDSTLTPPDSLAVTELISPDLRLSVTANDTTWLRIVFNDSLADEGIFYPGSMRTWTGKEKFYLRIGNVGGVKITLDDQMLILPGRSGQIANLMITKDKVIPIQNNEFPAAMRVMVRQ